MQAVNDPIIKEILESELGKGIDFYRYTRVNNPTPMNLVLDEAENQLNKKIPLYWVKGGYPEVFSLRGGSNSIVFNTRYLSITALIRQLFVNSMLSDSILKEVAERTALQIMAELGFEERKC